MAHLQDNRIDQCLNNIQKYEKWETCLQDKIALLVHHLYVLTYDEVLIVDPETPITKEEYNK